MATMKLSSRGMTRIRMPAISAMSGLSRRCRFMDVPLVRGWWIGKALLGPAARNCVSLPLDPVPHDPRHLRGLLDRGHVPAVLHDVQPGAGNAARQLLEELHGHDRIVAGGDHLRRAA